MAIESVSNERREEFEQLLQFASRPGPTRGPQEACSDPEDRLSARLQRAQALVAMTYGEQGEAFRRMADTIQDNYMWAVRDLLAAIETDVELTLAKCKSNLRSVATP